MIPSVFYGWWVVLAAFLISVYVGSCTFFGFTAMFEPMVREFGWSYAEISFASSLRGLEMGFLAPVVGVLVDRFGPRKILLVGIVATGLGFVLLSITQGLWMFYASSILLGFGAGGCTSVVTLAVVARWFRRNTGKAMGLAASGFGAGGLLVPVIVWLIDSYGWRSAVVIQGAGMWIMGIPMALLIRDQPEDMGLLPDGDPPSGPGADTAPRHPGDLRAEIPFRAALTSRPFINLNIVECLRFLAMTAVFIHVMPYLATKAIPRETAGLVAAAIPLLSIPGRLGFGWLGDVVEKRYVMAASLLCMAAGFVAFHHAAALWPLAAFVLLFSPGFGGNMVMRGAVIHEYFGVGSFGKLTGIAMGVGSLGGGVGPLIAGWVFDAKATYDPLWLVFGALLALTMFFALKVRREDAVC